MAAKDTNISNLILHCIESEDKKNPYTDEKIADLLEVSREVVTGVRKECNIPDSRERRRVILNNAVLKVLKEQPNISDRSLTRILNEQDFVIGKYAVSKIRDELTVTTKVNVEDDLAMFKSMIGYQGSLKNIIHQCLAALIYPPNGMNCLLIGRNGVGKSMLVKKLAAYAQKMERYQQNFKFCTINCVDYVNQEKTFLEILFGKNEQKGLLEEYDGGMIAIDNMQMFPIQGKELLFHYLDTHSFQRMDFRQELQSSAMIIGEMLDENLEFQRHFSMISELPTFEQRPIKEKVEFIKSCFSNESQSLGQGIVVKKETLLSLASYRYMNHLKQVQQEIKMACAKALLDQKMQDEGSIVVKFENLSESMRSTYYVHNRELQKIIRGDMIFAATGEGSYLRSGLMTSWDMYAEIDKRFNNLKNQGMGVQNAAKIVLDEIEMKLSKQIHDVEKSEMSTEEISAIVGKSILELSQEIFQRAKKDLPYLSESLIFPLSIHLKMIFERKNRKKLDFVDEIRKIKKNSLKEYMVAQNMMLFVSKALGNPLPEEEVIFLTMYFRKFQSQYFDMKKKIAVLVVSHGHVASAMAETSNLVMGEYHAVGLDLEFSDSPKVMADKVVAKVHEIDQGKGCIILADMGSLLYVKEKVERELGIPVGVLGRTDTLMVIECIRKTLWTNETIEEIVESLATKNNQGVYTGQTENRERKKAILSCCITGEGAAIQLENYLKQRFESVFQDIVWLHLGYADEMDMQERIHKLEEKYEIMACVGTLNPHVSDVPFYSSQEVYSTKGLHELKNYCGKYLGIYNALFEVLDVKCIRISSNEYSKEDVIDHAVEDLIREKRVTDKFLLSVYKRESWLPTYLQGDIGIPHGQSEFVTKSAIHITKLDKPICWDGENFVDFVFTIALKESDTEAFDELYKLIKEPAFMQVLRLCQNEEEILNKFVSIQY